MGTARPRNARDSRERWSRDSAARLTVAAWIAGITITALIIWSPYLVFGYRNPSLHLVLDSVDACVALLVAYLVYGRYQRSGSWQDLLLFNGLVLLAAAGLGLTWVTSLVGGLDAGTLDIWLPLVIRLVGALLIVAAALSDPRLTRRLTPRRLHALAPLALIAVVSLALWAGGDRLPVAFDQSFVPSSAQQAILTGHPVLLVAQGLAALSFLVASIAFATQPAQRGDELLRWLGPACALGGFARINYVLFPSLYTDWLYTGDLLRTGCYLMLLVGATREIRQYWTAQAGAAVLDDRRRLARELHDGVIQELAFIRSEAHSIPPHVASGIRIINATDRALDEARAALQALGRTGDEPLSFTLRRAATELAERYCIDLEVDLDDSIRVDPDQQHALMRITREAMSNAVRHGDAKRVLVRLGETHDIRHLAIEDNGSGFDVDLAVAGTAGYGLVGMRDRARGLPGAFSVAAGTTSGSVVRVEW